jgi:hypothetical protein
MTEVWLHANRRVLLFALVPALALTIVGALLTRASAGVAARGIGWGLLLFGVVLIVGLINQVRRPRVAFRDGDVLFHLRSGAPVAVPAEVVEAFFLGQGPANLPAVGNPTEAVNLVARISQKAPEWEKVDVKPAIGRWCEGYVTIRGMWCEPLNGEVVRRLNRRLREIREAAHADGTAKSSRE